MNPQLSPQQPGGSLLGPQRSQTVRAELSGMSHAEVVDRAIQAMAEAELLAVRLTHSQAQLADRGLEYDQAVASAEQTEQQRRNTLVELGRCRSGLSAAGQRIAELEAHAADLEHARDELTASRDAILASPSWRITAPLRRAKRLRP